MKPQITTCFHKVVSQMQRIGQLKQRHHSPLSLQPTPMLWWRISESQWFTNALRTLTQWNIGGQIVQLNQTMLLDPLMDCFHGRQVPL